MVETLEDRYMFSAASIVAENQLPGTSQSVWDLSDTGSDEIVGFATQFSVNRGETVQFKIDADGAPYHVDIYRVGYYQGNGARLIASINNPNPDLSSQPQAKFNLSTNSVDASNWQVSTSWHVPTTAVSGVYIADLYRDDNVGGRNQIIFVVRDDGSTSDMLFQTSDTTWQAYNTWGGTSLYTPNYPQGRALAVSYERPFANRETSPINYFFADEYPMIRFLEQNGYDVSYTSGQHIAMTSGSDLLSHDVFISVGHDEYWSSEQFYGVMNARDAGVNLAFFSGNEIFWKTRWVSSNAGDPYGTMVCYKETLDNALTDPSGIWTGTWADPRFSPPTDGGVAQNSLTGTLFTINALSNTDYTASTSMKLTSQYSALRFWRNTSVATLSGSSTLSVGDHVLGYEANSDVDNGFRPAGLIVLSATSVNVAQALYDYGGTFGPGTVTQNMTMYRAASGALVFSAGTVQYSWGLDNHHDIYSGSTDKNLQQATINLFADMGVQPATLMSGLIKATMSSDYLAPISTITSPVPGTSVQAGATVTIRGTAQDQGGGIIGGVEVSVDGGLTWHPASGTTSWTYSFTPRTSGEIKVMSRAVDDSGNIEQNGPVLTLNPPAVAGTYNLFGTSTPSTKDSGDGAAVELGMRFVSDVDAVVTSARFYKSSANTGTHVAHLWNSAGLLLATATFTNESSSGWQQVDFATPVAIQAGQVYVISYYAPNGHYAADKNYFATQGVDNGPLHGLASGVNGGDGVFVYGTKTAFPTSSYLNSNYYVDVVINTAVVSPSDTVAPRVLSYGAADGSTTLTTDSSIVITFSEALNPTTINTSTVELLNPDPTSVPAGCCGTPGGWCSGCPLVQGATTKVINATVTYDAAHNSVTITPTAPLSTLQTYTVYVKGGAQGVQDLAGNGLASDSAASFLTPAQAASVWSSVWSSSVVPTTVDGGDASSIEVGAKFYSDVDGTISGVRFYKSAGNTGTHTGSLWSSTGQLLATGTFTSESSSGWQTLTFATPVAITAGTTYVVSYHTDSGHYAADKNYFASQLNSGSLHILAGGGVYANGSGFPTINFQNTNYWVDVILRTPVPVDNVAPTIVSISPADGTTGVSVNPTITIAFSEALDATTVNSNMLRLMDNSNHLVSTTVTYNALTRTATITPTTPLAYNGNYTIVVAGGQLGVRDVAGNPLAQSVSSTFKVVAAPAPDTTPPVVISTNPANGGTGAPLSGPFTITFSEPLNAATVTAANANILKNGQLRVASTATYDAATNSITITPTSPLDYGSNYTIYIIGGSTGIRDLSDNALVSSFSSTFTTVAPPPPASIWSTSTTPSTVDVGEPQSLELGVKFSANTSGYVNGIRFYKSANNTGTHTGNLWSSTGQLLATGTFTNESSSGWQTLTFSTPVAITAGTTYIASYFDTNGHFSVNRYYFNSTMSSGSLSVPAAGGVFTYGSKSAFPTSVSSNSNYWVDVLFSTVPPIDSTPPTVLSMSPGNGATNVPITTSAVITFSEAINPLSLSSSTVQIVDGNTLVPATITYDSTTNTATITPLSPLTNGHTYTLNAIGGIPGLKDTAGNNLAQTVSITFTTVALPAPDTTPPTVTGISPAAGASSVAINAGVTISFSEALLASSVSASTFKLTAGSTTVAATVSYNSGNNTVTITPTAALSNNTTYTVTIVGGSSGVKDAAGNALAQNATSTFTTVALPPPDTTPPTVTGITPAAGASSVAINAGVTISFSEALLASSVSSNTFKLTAGSTTVAATVSYNSSNNTVTITPTASLGYGTTYTVTIVGGSSGVKDAAGNALAQSVTSTFTTVAAAPVSIWGTSTTPSTTDVGEAQSVELGVKFTFDTDGYVTGIRFYKSANNTGTHTGNLWSSTGQLLATGTFTGESSSGWQTLTFSTPVAIKAGTTYIASYFAPNGHFAVNRNYFKSAYTSGSLHVPAAGGVFTYGSNSAFPTSSFGSSNYWVDVLVTAAPPVDSTPPTVSGISPAAGTSSVAINSGVTISFSESLLASSVSSSTFKLTAGSTTVAATVSYNSGNNTVTITPTAALSNGTTYTVTIVGGSSGVKDAAGNALAQNVTSTFTTVALPPPDTTPPTVTGITPAAGASSVAINAGVTISFSEALLASSVSASTFKLTAGSTTVAATVSYNSGNNTVTITPTAALSNNTTYTVTIVGGSSGVKDAAGNALAQNATSTFTTVALPPPDTTPPTVTGISPAAGASSVAINAGVTISFSEALLASSVSSSTFKLTAGSTTVAATVSYNSGNNTVTITPTSSLGYGTTYTVTIVGGSSGVKDAAGNALAQSVTSTFTTVAAAPVSIWGTSTTPSVSDVGEAQSLEVGVKFTFDTDGYVTGIRFYKSANNTGTHTGSLWSSSGQLLATGTFTGESSSGWQTLTFSTPVAIKAGTTYIASYFAPNGHFAVNRNYFKSAYTSGSLHVPANGGVFTYGSNSAFPTSSFGSSNYWVDVLVTAAPPVDSTPPVVTSINPAFGATDVATGASITVAFSEALSAATVSSSTVKLTAGATAIAATVSYNQNSNTIIITPAAALSNSTTYTVTITGGASGVQDTAGNPLAQTFVSTFTTVALPVPDTTPPTVTSITPASGTSGVSSSAAVTVQFSEALLASSVSSSTFKLTAGSTTVAATVSYNSGNKTVTITPTAALSNNTTYTVTIVGGSSGVKDAAGNALAQSVTSTFTTAAMAPAVSLWGGTTTPSTTDVGEPQSVELGVKFTATTDGYITGVSFYKSANNTGTHTGSLWSSSGQLLATGTFTNETASGWQTLTFAQPVKVTAGTTYVASYFAPNGHFAVNRFYFNSPLTVGPLQVASSGGVFSYGSSSAFPSNSFASSNYWVDVLFSPST